MGAVIGECVGEGYGISPRVTHEPQSSTCLEGAGRLIMAKKSLGESSKGDQISKFSIRFFVKESGVLMASRLHNNAIEYNTEAQLKLKCYAQILGDDIILEALQLAAPG
eukprot:scaffold61572_cov23-Cyclotella_meneghiniana.AAC.2